MRTMTKFGAKMKRPRIKKARKEPIREREPGSPPDRIPLRMRMTGLWGRAASEHRPGLFTKAYLLEHGEGCAADVFYALKGNLERINKERIEIGDKPIRGCVYNSFAKYFFWFIMMGLVEPTDRHEPSIYSFLEERHFYRLTSKGEAEVRAWEDPVRTAHPEFG